MHRLSKCCIYKFQPLVTSADFLPAQLELSLFRFSLFKKIDEFKYAQRLDDIALYVALSHYLLTHMLYINTLPAVGS